MVKTLLDLLEESKLIVVRDNKILLGGTPIPQENGSMQQPGIIQTPAPITHTGVTTTSTPSTNIAAWTDLLLAKFPEFDPTWTDDVKLKWFDAFDRLMNLFKPSE